MGGCRRLGRQAGYFQGYSTEFAGLVHASEAGNTFGVQGGFVEFYSHRADMMAGLASGATVFVPAKGNELGFTEQRVKSAERAGCSAEGSAGQHAPANKKEEESEFIVKERADCPAQLRLQKKHGNACFQSAGRAEILAEISLAGAKGIDGEKRQKYDHDRQNDEFNETKGAWHIVFSGHGDLV